MPAEVHQPSASPDCSSLLNADPHLPSSPTLACTLQKCPGFTFLPSNNDSLDDALARNGPPPASAHFACDAFRMFEFKIRRCMRGRSHDWTECPFAHPGEKARRRDPRRVHYSGSPCPEFRKGSCRRGDACEFAHGVFECWLHPARYRTQECKDGQNCKRRVCFFAHSPEQLRVLPASLASPSRAEKAHGDTGGSSAESPSGEGLSEDVSALSPVDMAKTQQYIASVPTPSQPSTLHSPGQASPLAMSQDFATLSGSRRAAIQNAFACRAYGFNLNAAEYYPVLGGHETHTKAHVVCEPFASMQQMRFRSSLNESLFAKFCLPLEKSRYEYSHGFASPTSTLAGHAFSPPPLSPPLSPSASPNGSEFSESLANTANDCRNVFLNDTTVYNHLCDEAFGSFNQSHTEELGSCLQNIRIASRRDDGNVEENPCGIAQARQSATSSQQLRLPAFRNRTSNFSCTAKEELWGLAREFACFDSHALDFGCSGELTSEDLGISKLGEESTSEKFAPDLGWVWELVK